MSSPTADRLRQTVHVSETGVVTHGVVVPHEATNITGDFRLVATPPRVSRTRRFAPGGIPKGVDLSITLPHPCGYGEGCPVPVEQAA